MRDLDPEGRRLPIKVDSTSNGEHFPVPLTGDQVHANTLAHRRVSELARRLGLTRRQFLKSSAGAAATLLAFNEAHAQLRHTGGYFDIPREAADSRKQGHESHQGDDDSSLAHETLLKK